MVQGHDSTSYNKASSYNNYECAGTSKRSGFENMQKLDQARKQNAKESGTKDANNSASKYGAWGSVFKNEKNFKSLHHC